MKRPVHTTVGEEDFVQADIDGDGLIRWVWVKMDFSAPVITVRHLAVYFRPTTSRDEWRKWVQEKQRIMQAANKDRETLLNENRRLRMAMSPEAKHVSERIRRTDERLIRMEARNAELVSLV